MTVSGNTAVMASGKPFRPSTTASLAQHIEFHTPSSLEVFSQPSCGLIISFGLVGV